MAASAAASTTSVETQGPPPLAPGAALTLVSPSGGEKLTAGQSRAIRWKSAGDLSGGNRFNGQCGLLLGRRKQLDRCCLRRPEHGFVHLAGPRNGIEKMPGQGHIGPISGSERKVRRCFPDRVIGNLRSSAGGMSGYLAVRRGVAPVLSGQAPGDEADIPSGVLPACSRLKSKMRYAGWSGQLSCKGAKHKMPGKLSFPRHGSVTPAKSETGRPHGQVARAAENFADAGESFPRIRRMAVDSSNRHSSRSRFEYLRHQ